MRLKLYYQPEEIEDNLYTFGKEWMIQSTYQEYKGLYHKYLTGEVYTMPTYVPELSQKLVAYEEISESRFRYQEIRNDIQIKNEFVIVSYYPQLTQKNIDDGFITRYFVQKHNEQSIIEIDNVTYNIIKNDGLESVLYTIISVKWFISGPLEDNISSLVKNYGVVTKNLQQIQIASKTIKNISSKLSDPTELYIDTTYITPKDINQLDS